MSKFIDPFTDFGFKYLFGQEVSKDLLIDFLNDLLEGERVITDLTYMDKERLSESPNDRICVFDIYCLTDTGERIIVEMQNWSQANFKDRALFYMCEAIVGQGEKGVDWKYDYKAVYGVFFMNFSFAKTEKFRTDVVLADKETGCQFSDKFRQIFLSLPKFTIESETDCKTGLDKWIYVLKQMPMLELMPFEEQKAIFAKLKARAETGALTREEREKYEYSLKIVRDNLAVMEQARIDGHDIGYDEGYGEGLEKGMEKGMEEGMQKGLQEGMEKGMEEGLQKGKEVGIAEGIAIADAKNEEKRRLEKMQMAAALKASGVEFDVIAKSVGISLDEVEAL